MTPTHIKGARPNSDNNMRELERAQKEWRRPELRKLPISATAGNKGFGNEGAGQPKAGDSGPPSS